MEVRFRTLNITLQRKNNDEIMGNNSYDYFDDNYMSNHDEYAQSYKTSLDTLVILPMMRLT